MTFGSDESANLAAGGIERGDPFTLVRFGDGDLYCMKADTEQELAHMLHATLGDRPGRPPLALACGELMSMELRDSLRNAWHVLTTETERTLMLGDPKTSAFGRELYPYWDDLIDAVERPVILVHHELFWLRADPQPGLLRLCRALRESTARKILVGRAELEPAADLIRSDFIKVDTFSSLTDAPRVAKEASRHDLIILCAGRGGKEMTVRLLHPYRTIIDAGALFDPLFVGATRPRPGAASDTDAEAFFSQVADSPIAVAAHRPGRKYG